MDFNEAVADMEVAESLAALDAAVTQAKAALARHTELLSQRESLGRSQASIQAAYSRSLASVEVAAEARAAMLQ